jgi:hypothetical protein
MRFGTRARIGQRGLQDKGCDGVSATLLVLTNRQAWPPSAVRAKEGFRRGLGTVMGLMCWGNRQKSSVQPCFYRHGGCRRPVFRRAPPEIDAGQVSQSAPIETQGWRKAPFGNLKRHLSL